LGDNSQFLFFSLTIFYSFQILYNKHVLLISKDKRMVGMVVHACNPSTREAEAGRSRVQAQPRLRGETLSQNKQTKKELIVA
jgi:hypothetical protein